MTIYMYCPHNMPTDVETLQQWVLGREQTICELRAQVALLKEMLLEWVPE